MVYVLDVVAFVVMDHPCLLLPGLCVIYEVSRLVHLTLVGLIAIDAQGLFVLEAVEREELPVLLAVELVDPD